MINKKLSIIVPFYNPPYEVFKECLSYLKKLNPLEVILVDDCSSELKVVTLAKQSGFTYLKTPYQSGHDGLPFNLGVQRAQGEFVCKVENSMQTSKSAYYHRLNNIQTVARFAQLENISPKQSEYYLQLAMLNLRYGANSKKILKQQKIANEILTCKNENQTKRKTI